MHPLLTPDDVHRIDTSCSQDYGLPILLLMEHAARSATAIIGTIIGEGAGRRRILVACGTGNNGGDGFAVARLLADDHDVVVVAPDDLDRYSGAVRVNADAARKRVPFVGWTSVHEALAASPDVIIDAVMGVGYTAPLRPDVADLLRALATVECCRIALDMPTGVDARTGHADPDSVAVDHTITMAAAKPGLLRNAGRDLAGTIHVAWMGAPAGLVDRMATGGGVVERADLERWLPRRPRTATKFDGGRVVVIGGSTAMPGAASLAAHAALATGAGIVELMTTAVHAATPREVMPTILPATGRGTIGRAALPTLLSAMERATVLVVGPGLTDDDETRDTMVALLDACDPDLAIVVDADGLRAVPHIGLPRPSMVCTPHLGECSRLIGRPRDVLALATTEVATSLAVSMGCVMHLKDVPSVTTDGGEVFYTTNGNPAMATAGSGDVLAGIVGGLLAQRVDDHAGSVVRAAALGAWLHAEAGDRLVAGKARPRLLAGDLIDMIGQVLA